MNKKAFTLIELLGVFVILAVLFLIITPTVNSIISNSKEKAFDRNITTILSGASDWATENPKYLPEKNQKINITLSQLKQLGYVGLNIKNPKTGELFSNNMIITIQNIKGQTINPTEENVKYNGDYKFSINLDTGDSSITYDEDAPIITLIGDMVQMVELNSEYEEPGYSALTSTGDNITDSVTSVIRTSSEDINIIDTTTLGVYYKDYTVIDNSISTTVTRTIIVSDTTAPSINFDDTFVSEISTSEDTINLLTGVSCTDNSGVCNITTSGNITPGVSGKYVIKYIASDESGNTYSEKKVIVIK